MKITVIGCGRWGSLITWYLDRIGNEVTLYGRNNSNNMKSFLTNRKNDLLELPLSVKLSTDLECVKNAKVIVVSINSQGFQSLLDELKSLNIKNKIFILCMKGIELSTNRRLTEVFNDSMDSSNSVAVWLGPGHVQEFYKGNPNCMVIDSENEEVKHFLVDSFSSELIRFYYGTDLIGNEIGAAAKNVIGIAAGMLDGYNLSALKGALMSRGTTEISRLIKAYGGKEITAYGLCHLGDYEATVFSKHSHNRQFGESFVKGENYDKLAEGYYTCKALVDMGKIKNVETPICSAVYGILYNNDNPKETLNSLFSRSVKSEF